MQVLQTLNQLLAQVASEEILPRFLQVGHTRKDDGSLLTEADLACQAKLCKILPTLAPYPVLGEEMSDGTQQRLWQDNAAGLWVVDPIDGTSNFINGIPHFAISVALVRQGISEIGIIYNPVTRETFYASRGQGAYFNGCLLPVRTTESLMIDAIAGLDTKYLGSARLVARLNSVAPFATSRIMGSSTLDWCYLAAGRLDIYLHGGQRLWDYAAGALILEEAGGRIATLNHDHFWADQPWQRSVIAARNPSLFQCWYHWVRNNQ